MKNILHTLCLLMLPLCVFSQDLHELQQRIKKEDNARNRNALAKYYAEKEDTAMYRITAEKAYALALKEKNTEETGAALIHLAEVEFNKGEYMAYIEKNEEALSYLLQTERMDLQSQALGNIGYIYNAFGEFDKAIRYFQQALALEQRINKEIVPALAELNHNIGNAFLNKGASDSAIYYTTEAIILSEALKDTGVIIDANNLLGVIYKRLNNYEKGLQHYERCLELHELTHDDIQASFTWMNIATLYADWKKHDKALLFARKSVELAFRSNMDKDDVGRLLTNLGTVLFYNKQYAAARDTLRAAIPFIGDNAYQNYINDIALSGTYIHLNNADSAGYYLENAGKLLAGNENFPAYRFNKYKGLLLVNSQSYGEAIPYLESYLNDPKYSFTADDYEVMNALSKAYESGTKDYKKALYYSRLAYEKRDSLYKEEHNLTINDFYARYETAEKELEISRLNEERQKILYNRTLLAGGLVIAFIVLLLLLMYNRYLRMKKQKEAEEFTKRIEQKDLLFEATKKEYEIQHIRHYLHGLETERNRIAKELHDNVANELVAIEHSIRKSDMQATSVPARIEQLHASIRNLSHELISPSFQYASLGEILSLYVHTLNEDSRIKFQLNVPESIFTGSLSGQLSLEIYRIIQEASSNIIKHSSAQNAWITLSDENERLTVVIEDDGMGFNTQERTGGVGLRIVRDRATEVNGECSISSQTGKGTKITVVIPYPSSTHK